MSILLAQNSLILFDSVKAEAEKNLFTTAMVIINKVMMEEMMDISALFKLAKTSAEAANYMRQRLCPSDPKSLE